MTGKTDQGCDGAVLSVNVSADKGMAKKPVPSIRVDELGIKGDAHAGRWHRQVSLLSDECIQQFSSKVGREFGPGDFAENITTRGIDLTQVAILDELTIGEVRLQITQIGKTCHPKNCSVFEQVGKCVMPKEGVFCRVLSGGAISTGDAIDYRPRTLSFLVITLSDRASRGEYEDRSGPRIVSMLGDFFGPKRWRHKVDNVLLPDDPKKLRRQLGTARQEGVDVVITTGGTGVGPRDVAPDVVVSLCDMLIPGIMDDIRLKCGQQNPNALLSRSIAGVMEKTLVYALPGSVRAVEEYMTEILKTMEHLLLTVRGIDPH